MKMIIKYAVFSRQPYNGFALSALNLSSVFFSAMKQGVLFEIRKSNI